jgi:hypothetical protein
MAMKKFKFASADAKRTHEQLERDWIELKKKHGVEDEERRRNRAMAAPNLIYSLNGPTDRASSSHIPSRGASTGSAPLKETPVYTGTKMIGIAVMHKSCLQPIFSDEEARDSASMRR